MNIGTLSPITLSSSLNGNGGVRIAVNNEVLPANNTGSNGFYPNDSGQHIIGETFAAQIQ